MKLFIINGSPVLANTVQEAISKYRGINTESLS